MKKRIKQVDSIIDEMEKSLLQLDDNSSAKFSAYLKEREKSVLRALIRNTRRKGGMPLDVNGVPIRVYTHQSETVNSMLAAQKLSLGYTKKDDLQKSEFILKVWQQVVSYQEKEIERAFYGQSQRYFLKKEAAYLKVNIEDWYNWSESERKG